MGLLDRLRNPSKLDIATFLSWSVKDRATELLYMVLHSLGVEPRRKLVVLMHGGRSFMRLQVEEGGERSQESREITWAQMATIVRHVRLRGWDVECVDLNPDSETIDIMAASRALVGRSYKYPFWWTPYKLVA